MKFIRLSGDAVINIDHIDGLCNDWKNHKTMIYTNGAKDPFKVDESIDEILRLLGDSVQIIDSEMRQQNLAEDKEWGTMEERGYQWDESAKAWRSGW